MSIGVELISRIYSMIKEYETRKPNLYMGIDVYYDLKQESRPPSPMQIVNNSWQFAGYPIVLVFADTGFVELGLSTSKDLM